MDFGFMEWTQNQNSGLLWPNVQSKEEQKYEERYKDVPIVVAPGQEEAYLQSLEQCDKAKMVRTEQDEIMKEEKMKLLFLPMMRNNMYKRYKVRK